MKKREGMEEVWWVTMVLVTTVGGDSRVMTMVVGYWHWLSLLFPSWRRLLSWLGFSRGRNEEGLQGEFERYQRESYGAFVGFFLDSFPMWGKDPNEKVHFVSLI